MRYILGIDVGSTTCKYILADDKGNQIDKRYERHNTKTAEKVYQFLSYLEDTYKIHKSDTSVYFTGSGATLISQLVGGRYVQEVVAVSTAVEKLHPKVRFVSEIGGEDMKTIFIKEDGKGNKNKHVYMQNACAGGTGTFIEKIARKLGVPSNKLSQMGYLGYTLHKVSSKCGIFAEADVNTLLKAGVSVEEIMASLFEAVVYQNLAQLTKGNTPLPEVLLLGGPNLFFKGLQEAWRFHLRSIWKEKGIGEFSYEEMEKLVYVPEDSLFYGALGCVFTALEEGTEPNYQGLDKLRWWIEEGQYQQKLSEGRKPLVESYEEVRELKERYVPKRWNYIGEKPDRIYIGCDFGSTTAKAVILDENRNIVKTYYTISKGNPIEDAKGIFRSIKEDFGSVTVLGLGVTGYGKDLLKDVIGADVAIVETVAHATAGLFFFPDADCICDVGGVDVKIIILRNGTVVDFRLNSQCSSGNGAFLQGVAERFGIPLEEIADRAFSAKAIPNFSMGCGVFLQSDIVNQQRKGWQADEILAGLCSVLPLNVWVYAGNINNFSHVGKRFILQGGTHRNIAVVKAQIDFLRSKIPDCEIYVHPYSGEAGAIGAALVAMEVTSGKSSFKGFDVIESLSYRTTTSKDTVCKWCPIECQRTFVDVYVGEGEGRPWSKVPLEKGYIRIIVNNACPKGLVESPEELKVIKEKMERVKNEFPNIGITVKKEAFKKSRQVSA